MVSYDGLDARLVVHVHDEYFTASGSHCIRPVLISLLASEEIMYKDVMYPVIISRMYKVYDVLSNVVLG